MADQAIGRVAFVTGGSRGIGEAVVRRLAKEGIAVAFTDVTLTDESRQVVKDIESAGGKALAIQADSADAAAVKSAIDQTVGHFGRLDIVVPNAGIAIMKKIDEMTIEEFDTIIAINLRGTFAAILYAVPYLPEGGRIVTIGSDTAFRTGFPGVSAYTATKAAIATLVRGVALDLGPKRINVNNVAPGPVATKMNEGNGEMLTPLIPIGRMGEAADVAGMVAYLVSDEATWITGSSFVIDGGFIA